MKLQYGDEALRYLSGKDRRMGEVIARVGRVEREAEPEVFAALLKQMVGQQISMKAMETVWGRVADVLNGDISAGRLLAAPAADLRACGLSERKLACMTAFARKVTDGAFDIEALHTLSDAEAVAQLTSLDGVGVWTAEMMLIFCLQRPDVLSFGDFGIRKGLRMIYRHRVLTRALFEKYRRRFSPYGSVASLYLWAVAGGALPELTDPERRASR